MITLMVIISLTTNLKLFFVRSHKQMRRVMLKTLQYKLLTISKDALTLPRSPPSFRGKFRSRTSTTSIGRALSWRTSARACTASCSAPPQLASAAETVDGTTAPPPFAFQVSWSTLILFSIYTNKINFNKIKIPRLTMAMFRVKILQVRPRKFFKGP